MVVITRVGGGGMWRRQVCTRGRGCRGLWTLALSPECEEFAVADLRGLVDLATCIARPSPNSPRAVGGRGRACATLGPTSKRAPASDRWVDRGQRRMQMCRVRDISQQGSDRCRAPPVSARTSASGGIPPGRCRREPSGLPSKSARPRSSCSKGRVPGSRGPENQPPKGSWQAPYSKSPL